MPIVDNRIILPGAFSHSHSKLQWLEN